MALPASCSRRQAALDFLWGRIDYERTVGVAYSEQHYKLDRTRELLARLGNPHDRLATLHVAGTKGKGSTSTMLAAVLTAAGYRTGLFSSPHLDQIEERFAVDGQMATGDELADLVDLLRPVVAEMDAEAASPAQMGPTYFELTTAMAWLHFVRQKADAAVMEVGMGGRLDSTNVCQPRVAVITSISFDHQRHLGATLAQIAGEKAGIIKPGVPVISGVTADEPRRVIEQVAHDRGSPLYELERDFCINYRPARDLEARPGSSLIDFQSLRPDAPRDYRDLALGLPGRHQANNAAVAVATLVELQQQGWKLPETALRQGLEQAVCAARVEVVRRRPTIVVDAAHNVASIEALLATLNESFTARRRVLLFATTQEKDVELMLSRLAGEFDDAIFTRYLNNPRAVPPDELATLAAQAGFARWRVVESPIEAYGQLLQSLDPDDLGCITGSFFLAAEIRRHIAAPA